MSRVLIVGPRDLLEPAILRLHGLKAVHLVDYRGEDEGFEIGKPLPRAAEVSENLVKLRAIAATLKVEKPTEVVPEVPADARPRILALEGNINEEEGNRKNIEGLLSDLDRKVEERRPFAALGLPFELYHGYDRIAVLAGTLTKDLPGLDPVAPHHEVFRAEGAVAVFVPKEKEGDVRDFLGRHGFTQVDVPEREGSPPAVLAALEAERTKWRQRLTEIEGRLETLRTKYATFLLSAEAGLEVEIEKVEAPLRFATTEHSFVIQGWVPSSRAQALQADLASLRGVHMEAEAPMAAPAEHHGKAEPDPPVRLMNKGSAKRFEFLIHLFSTPSYKELDPTLIVSLIFPVFFGLMIGDAGYGLLWAGLGALGYAKLKPGDFRNLMFVMMVGGLMAAIFGLLVWGEAFGIPFHLKVPSDIAAQAAVNPAAASFRYVEWTREAAHELTWACGDLPGVANPCLGISAPLYPLMNKLQKPDVVVMLLLSLTAALIHLGIGFVLGFVNEWGHSKKHALSKIGWILALVGLFALILGGVKPGCDTARDTGLGVASHCQYTYFVGDTILAWANLDAQVTIPVLQFAIPLSSLILLIAAAAVVMATESPMAVMEIAGVLANMVSYGRLAGIGVAKAATASAFNTVIFPLVLGGSLGWVVFGFVLLFLAQSLVFFLGAISAGIQAIRLNYVEFFIKFFKGNGTVFHPFGARATTEV
ncbi:MAG TPA: V-type ATP synthase subunit I [Thermoplasmata archaeon]|nr:V-type ATP synthase subunit I [Thermoplasmata archaeon]